LTFALRARGSTARDNKENFQTTTSLTPNRRSSDQIAGLPIKLETAGVRPRGPRRSHDNHENRSKSKGPDK